MIRKFAVSFLMLITMTEITHAEVLRFGVVPQQSASRLARVWLPVLEVVSKETGLQIEFTTARDIPTFESCLAEQRYDLAYMNPYHYVIFNESAGYTAFAKQAGHRLKGILVARKDSKLEELEDLQGLQLAFPSPAAFGASVIPRAELAVAGVTFSPVYVNSHDSVYMSVAAGLFSAGGGVLRTWNTIAAEVRDQLQIFHSTRGYTPHAFAANPSLGVDRFASVQKALTALQNQNPDVLKPLGMKGIEQAVDSDWDDIRSLNLTKTQTEILDRGSGKCPSN